ncbi:MAG: PAS domain S-box protein [Cyanobacteria bacterium HKST-UBA02]|nr:PAS domain S-box protein [Cyanobacteria bacterium HKST-UBA02]
MTSLGLTQKIILLVSVPLIVEMLFLATISASLRQAGEALEQETRAVEALVCVNGILNDVMSRSAAVLLKRSLKDPSIYLDVESGYENLQKSTMKLRELARDTGPAAREIESFLAAIEEITDSAETFQLSEEESFGVDSVIVKERLESSLRKLDGIRKVVVEEQLRQREKALSRENELRGHLILAVEIAAIIDLLLAAGIALWFSLTTGRRLHILATNTASIALGKGLEKPLGGADELARFDGVLHDLSRALKIARQQERAMIDNTAEVICSLDESFKITESNRAVERRLGFRQEELRGANLLTFIHPDDRENTFEELEKCKGEADELSFSSRMRKADGKFIYADWVVQWSPADRSVFCVIHDVTERKEAEQLKQEVIAMVSHDLRTPLTSLAVGLEILAEGRHGELSDRGKRLVDNGMVSIKSLISLTNDLIDIERFEAGMINLDVELVDVDSLISEAIETVRSAAESRKIVIEKSVKGEIFAEMDDERIQRVLVNLIGNAIKFTPSGRRIDVIARILKNVSGEENLRIEIIDQGPGIPPDQVDLVFEKFRQVGTGSEGEKKGSGLGLAISKELVIAHDGKIGVTSDPGQGSTFWFEIPVRQQGKK